MCTLESILITLQINENVGDEIDGPVQRELSYNCLTTGPDIFKRNVYLNRLYARPAMEKHFQASNHIPKNNMMIYKRKRIKPGHTNLFFVQYVCDE